MDIVMDDGVTVLTIPPHCSNHMQPLDISVFRSFQMHYNAAIESWMLHHPGYPLTIYEIAECVGIAFQHSMSPTNICSGFRKAGIFPLDRGIFTEEDFMSSDVTDRAVPGTSKDPTENEGEGRIATRTREEISSYPTQLGSVNRETMEPETQVSAEHSYAAIVTPQLFRGYPKASDRKDTVKKRKRGKSCIATDTPIKQAFLNRLYWYLIRMKIRTVKAKKRTVILTQNTNLDKVIMFWLSFQGKVMFIMPGNFYQIVIMNVTLRLAISGKSIKLKGNTFFHRNHMSIKWTLL
ncbi:hypothetical protein PR048_010647 [Dryococelus australis]|uniref:DDE-1 domain-containing protein n=1 Tax=Dryococelus australis TaxID=614101 RepID=A0ABQ9I3B6_9NEOP|nr:hypothetical protein PR048_010647 [Dryococelus australis]